MQLALFTKPWPNRSIPELGARVRRLGFDGVELPVRPGFQVTPEDAARQLPHAVRVLHEQGLQVFSLATATTEPLDERIIAACATAGVPLIRILARLEWGESYVAAEDRCRRELTALLPLLERHGVRLGVQNHSERWLAPNALALRDLLRGFDPRHIGAVWDAGHEAAAGTSMDLALDVIWPQLAMVTLKSAFWQRAHERGAGDPGWELSWTTGRHGLADWPLATATLKQRGYQGTVCLAAEYSDEAAVDRLIVEDLAYARELLS